MFSKLLQKVQEEEVRMADIPNLVTCPFCSFAKVIDDNNVRVFQCENPECLRESCRLLFFLRVSVTAVSVYLSISCRNDFRLCREPSHIPLRCNEVERQGETSMRAYIENKMSEAMLRQCHKCKKRFYKTEGCNSMRCTCGAMMCYVCRKPIKSYDHFRRRYTTQCLSSSVPYKVFFLHARHDWLIVFQQKM